MSASPSYAAELERLAPAGNGFEWVGFISDPVEVSSGQVPELTTQMAFGLPPAQNGFPFAGPFEYRPVVGVRQVPGAGPDTPVSCGTLTGSIIDRPCVVAPSEAEIASNLDSATVDLGLAAASSGSGNVGEPITVTFQARQDASGGSTEATYDMSASSDLAGAQLTVEPAQLTLVGDETRTVAVTFTAPPGTPAGTHDVGLAASHGSQTRTVTGIAEVTKVATTTSLSISSADPVVVEPITLSARVAPATASGTVTFVNNGEPIFGCEVVELDDARADCTTSWSSTGLHVLSAEYGGDDGHLGSMSAELLRHVGPASTTMTASKPSYPGLTSVTVRATLQHATTDAAVAGQSIRFTVGNRIVRNLARLTVPRPILRQSTPSVVVDCRKIDEEGSL